MTVYTPLAFEKIAPGVWKAAAGCVRPEYSLLVNAGSVPSRALKSCSDMPFPFSTDCLFALPDGKTALSIPFDKNERLYGLGLNFSSISQNLHARELRTDHYGGSDNGRTHVPAPFYLSDRGYGVYIDTNARPTFYMGGAVRVGDPDASPEKNRGRDDDWSASPSGSYVEVTFEGGADIYIIAGASLTDVSARFNLLCGGGCLPPKWGLGMWHRVNIRYSADDVRREVEEFAAHDMPLDVIGLEPGWMSNSYPCTFDWDIERFPDPDAFTDELLAKGIRLNLWQNMYISQKSSIYRDILPHCGSHTVWCGAVPDYTLPEVEKIIINQAKRNRPRISGYKIDECDGYDNWLWPDHATFPSGISGGRMRQILALRVMRTYEKLYRESGRRTFGLVRASNAGGSRFPYCIYNDCYDFRQFMVGLASAGMCGTLWCPEIRDAKNGDEWVRRFRMSAFSPMLQLNGWANGAKPWMFPEVEDEVRNIIKLRRALVPYLYNAFADYAFKGIPPFRALCMDYGTMTAGATDGTLDHTRNPYNISELRDLTDQYMIGGCVMSAPAFPGASSRSVVFPGGRWYDFDTGELAGDNSRETLECPLDRSMLFVREGGMVPLIGDDGALHVRCFGDEGECTLYDDDGESYAYEDGAFALLRLSFKRENGVVRGEYTVEPHRGFETGYTKIVFE